MSEPSPDTRRFQRQSNIILWVVLTVFVVICGSIGVGVARAYPSRDYPELSLVIRIGLGLLIMAAGLLRQFQLAAYGPRFPSQNRVQESVSNSAMILLGAVQLMTDNFVRVPVGAIALVLIAVGLLRRPRRFFQVDTLSGNSHGRAES